jgi:hypothetical protein
LAIERRAGTADARQLFLGIGQLFACALRTFLKALLFALQNLLDRECSSAALLIRHQNPILCLNAVRMIASAHRNREPRWFAPRRTLFDALAAAGWRGERV